jgi:MoxR-like ATPase
LNDQGHLTALDGGGSSERGLLETAVFEIKRVIAGQDEMLERVFVCLLAGGHLLIEGVPGLAKTLTVKTVAEVFGGTFERIQFTPDLVPADLVGTRMYRARSERFDIELGPVFCNFLLADEINRAPAKVQSALLEVMQERQVTIGKETYPVPAPFLVMATQNPIESEGTYPLPEAQIDRFMLKIVVDYPAEADELTVIERALADPVQVEQLVSVQQLEELQLMTRRVYVDPAVARYALEIALATRKLDDNGLGELAQYVSYGASPRGPINLVLGARALAVLRGRRYALPQDVHALAKDVLRHRMVLSYEALAEGVEADAILDRVLEAIPMPHLDLARGAVA